jgi:hypothetical protein
MDAHAHTMYLYEHFRETEPAHHFEIDEVATDAFSDINGYGFIKKDKGIMTEHLST